MPEEPGRRNALVKTTPVKPTKLVPPKPAKRRAERLPETYAMLRGWLDNGFDYFDIEHLRTVARFSEQLDRDPRRQTAAMFVFLLVVEYKTRVLMSKEAWGPQKRLSFYRDALRRRSDPESRAALKTLDELHWRQINALPVEGMATVLARMIVWNEPEGVWQIGWDGVRIAHADIRKEELYPVARWLLDGGLGRADGLRVSPEDLRLLPRPDAELLKQLEQLKPKKTAGSLPTTSATLGPPLSDKELSAGLLAFRKAHPKVYRELSDLARRAQHRMVGVVPPKKLEELGIPEYRRLPSGREFEGELSWWGQKAGALGKELGPEFLDDSYNPVLLNKEREAKVRAWKSAVVRASKRPNRFAHFEE